SKLHVDGVVKIYPTDIIELLTGQQCSKMILKAVFSSGNRTGSCSENAIPCASIRNLKATPVKNDRQVFCECRGSGNPVRIAPCFSGMKRVVRV
ncbi:MAG: hypothetical protein WBV91_09450, partial [Desulfobacterales bacterium]